MIDKRHPHSPQNAELSSLDSSALPLPGIIRYFDDFADRSRIIRTNTNNWSVITDGNTITMNWSIYSPVETLFLKKFLVWIYAHLDATTAFTYIGLLKRDPQGIARWLKCFTHQDTAKSVWELDGYNSVTENFAMVLRSISKFMCEMSLCGWSLDDREYIRGWKWFPPKNVSNVEHGVSYYLTPSQERRVISYFDELALRPNQYPLHVLRNATVLYFCYQFGMRPIQIGSITANDVSCFKTEGKDIVHVTFYKAKQRKSKAREPLLRKVKREWASIITKYLVVRETSPERQSDLVRADSLFNLTPAQISVNVQSLSTTLIGKGISPTLFRHIAAQRMADLGMSQLELAEFMGHSDIDSCLIYFKNSATQGQIVNRALGLSEIYNKVKEFTEFGLIGTDDLNALPEDQQVGGAAHGIPLAGIGGCAIGQSMCELSPAISCYTCAKFMPLNNLKMHKNVANELRGVIASFVKAGRNDSSNPAFAQLTRTMERLTSTIEWIEAESE